MVADFCRSIKRDIPYTTREKRKDLKLIICISITTVFHRNRSKVYYQNATFNIKSMCNILASVTQVRVAFPGLQDDIKLISMTFVSSTGAGIAKGKGTDGFMI